jgi:hypothetical protein
MPDKSRLTCVVRDCLSGSLARLPCWPDGSDSADDLLRNWPRQFVGEAQGVLELQRILRTAGSIELPIGTNHVRAQELLPALSALPPLNRLKWVSFASRLTRAPNIVLSQSPPRRNL